MTDTEPVAETVRRGAKLLRKRATAATPGPWVLRWDGQQCQVEALATPEGNPIAEWTYAIATWEPRVSIERDECDTGDASYIAALHPGVALLIADSWEHQADDMADHEAYESGVGGMLRPVVRTEDHGTRHDWTATLAAARALLGETP